MMHRITLITGGARSGKSRYSLELAEPHEHGYFIATAVPCDDEMAARIEKHKKDRPDPFTTVEEPIDLAGAVKSLPPEADIAVIDCLTVWTANLMHDREADAPLPEIDDLLTILHAPPCDLILVANEVGMGIVPENALARRFRDVAGSLNQRVAAAANSVIFMVSGLPIIVK